MSERRYSVLVDPRRWSAGRDELAELLVPVTHYPLERLRKALQRGAVTLDAELRREEAELLVERLHRMDIPLRVEDEDGAVVRSIGPAGRIEAGGAEEGRRREGAESPAQRQSAQKQPARKQQDGDAGSEGAADGWEAMFDDPPGEVGGQRGDDAGERAEAGDDEAGESEDRWADAFEAAQRQVEAEVEQGPSEERSEPPAHAAEPDDTGRSDGGDVASADATPEDAAADVSPPEDASARHTSDRRGFGADIASEDRRGFDSVAMSEVLAEPEAGGSEGTTGFDDRPEHIPPLAVLLAVVAPGAGAIYNGSAERGRRLGFEGLLIWPWLRSIARAWREADAIESGAAEQPPRGALGAALRHCGLWWGAALAVGAVVVVGARLAVDLRSVEPDRTAAIADRARENARTQAILEVQHARIEAREQVLRQGQPTERFTMDRQERAARLFRIGLEHCRAREFDVCRSAMKKAGRLSETYRRRAFRLQAWASSQVDPEAPRKEMPAIDVEAPTLSEYGERQARQQAEASPEAAQSSEE